MRVLHFYKTYYPDTVGGVEQVIYQICRGAAQFGVESTVLSLTRERFGDEPIDVNGHKVYRARMNFEIASNAVSISSLALFAKLARQADIIHYHYPWPFGDLVHFATRHGKRTVVTYHSDIVRQRVLLQLYRPLQHRFLADVDRIVATSPNYVETSSVLARYRDKVEAIPIGIDKSTYPEPDEALISKWRARVGDRFFLFVGMLRYYKGLEVLLAAAHKTSHPVVIVGAGPLDGALRRQVAEGSMQNVHLLGALPDEDKVALLKLCYGVVLPSHLRSEAFGVSLLEGAMFGKPLISCEIGTGTSYINEHGVTGLVIPPNDALALREAMDQISKHPDIASKMGERAGSRYFELFTAKTMAASYAKLYSELVGAGAP